MNEWMNEWMIEWMIEWMNEFIHRINLYPVDNAVGFPNTYHWIVMNPVDSTIQVQLLNNWGLGPVVQSRVKLTQDFSVYFELSFTAKR